ncbi:MAG: TBC1 domain family protein [Amphiamblys sp. WSBS2006]|nr:MAG: TBC1 domain family protein [Amphiamblys sp. WSBS2006]
MDFPSEETLPPDTDHRQEQKIRAALDSDSIDQNSLRQHAWNGLPSKNRAVVWKFLLGYLSPSRQNRQILLAQKRSQYAAIKTKTHTEEALKTEENTKTARQIDADLPRIQSSAAFFKTKFACETLRNILLCLAHHRPSIGYIQGMAEIACPLLYVFSRDAFSKTPDEKAVADVEADCFWCFLSVVDSIQKNFTQTHAGIAEHTDKIEKIVGKIDPELLRHLQRENVLFIHFCFRWISCLLVREIPLECIIRMWDTYTAEGRRAFSVFHVYVCCVFLMRWREELLQMSFPEILVLLQNPPTEHWGEREVSLLLSEAYFLQCLF